MKRASRAEADRPDTALYVDEMHNYLVLPRSFEDLLAEARGYRLSLVLAHQHMGQLPRDMRDALGANARTKIVFTCSPEDAFNLARHYAPELGEQDLSHLSTFQAACRPCVGGGQGAAFTFRTLQLVDGSTDRSDAVKERSAARFAADRNVVEGVIRRRQLNPVTSLVPSELVQSAEQPAAQPETHSGAHSWLDPSEGRDGPGQEASVTGSVPTPTRERARARPRTDRLRLQSIAASITERDQRICIDLFEHRILTTIQLYELHFPSYPRARKRLLELAPAGAPVADPTAETTRVAPLALHPRRARSARRGREVGASSQPSSGSDSTACSGCWTAPGSDTCVRRTGSSPGSPTPAGLASTRTGSPGGGESAPAPSDGRGWCARTGSAGWMGRRAQ